MGDADACPHPGFFNIQEDWFCLIKEVPFPAKSDLYWQLPALL